MTASRVNGVATISNNITVVYPEATWSGSEWKTDWEIKRDIEEQLYWSPFVDANQVSVSVTDGVATLTGAVQDWVERSTAANNALEGGARAVRNNLRVQGGIDWLF